ncbi:hypothetical protein [Sphingomonas bacterium]|uniref:hypothetical protein n=1 Tax=Sphingomonas bacterium TaxID=1895847 RepID=UPI00261DF7FC|nr:hypothetical protein [Sphingomonas bacterium]MDB5679993.1 putative rane protein [Sphingomonas bacterium]
MTNIWLAAGGTLSAVGSLLHLGCIFGGPSWYRALGAQERMARMAEQGKLEPAIITFGIALILAVWAAYAFSGAGLIGRLPLLRTGLVVICAIYLARAAALPLMIRYWPGNLSPTFLTVSSAIVLVFGVVHLIGLMTGWAQLSGDR